uniref:Uncharacterized protein n=1 Tax=Knipowitschia caucasica TaxID=637954 RepID=A0AAV2L8L1_KNICA
MSPPRGAPASEGRVRSLFASPLPIGRLGNELWTPPSAVSRLALRLFSQKASASAAHTYGPLSYLLCARRVHIRRLIAMRRLRSDPRFPSRQALTQTKPRAAAPAFPFASHLCHLPDNPQRAQHGNKHVSTTPHHPAEY